MGDVVDLQANQLAKLRDDHEFLSDLCRFSEQILTEAQVRRKWHLVSDATFEALGSDEELIERVELEKVRRIRSGAAKREKSQLLILEAPEILGAIMKDPGNSPRHRIDSAKALDDFAANGPAAAAAQDRFTITINLGADLDGKPLIETYDKSITIDANDGTGTKPAASGRVPPRIITDKPWDDYGG